MTTKEDTINRILTANCKVIAPWRNHERADVSRTDAGCMAKRLIPLKAIRPIIHMMAKRVISDNV